MDVIEIRDIRALGKHGARPGERDREQPFDIDVEIGIDLDRPSSSDDLADTIDYDELHKTIVRMVRDRSYALLERLAAEIVNAVFADERVDRVSVSIAKPNLLDGATPRVTLHRQRRDARR